MKRKEKDKNKINTQKNCNTYVAKIFYQQIVIIDFLKKIIIIYNNKVDAQSRAMLNFYYKR